MATTELQPRIVQQLRLTIDPDWSYYLQDTQIVRTNGYDDEVIGRCTFRSERGWTYYVGDDGNIWARPLPGEEASLDGRSAAEIRRVRRAGPIKSSARLRTTFRRSLPRAEKAALALVEPAIQIITSARRSGGRSRIGGLPDLPEGLEWPRATDGRPLGFVAQIDLAAAARCDRERRLPRRGMLWFFYDGEEQPWGFDLAHRGGSAVLFDDGRAALRPRRAPAGLPRESRFHVRWLEFERRLTLPHSDSRTLAPLHLDENDRERWDELRFDLEADGLWPRHQMLGWPEPIQDSNMDETAALLANGLAPRSRTARARALRKHANDWVLLLQIASEDAARMHWGDDGMLYVWVHRRALAAGRFDPIWTILECG